MLLNQAGERGRRAAPAPDTEEANAAASGRATPDRSSRGGESRRPQRRQGRPPSGDPGERGPLRPRGAPRRAWETHDPTARPLGRLRAADSKGGTRGVRVRVCVSVSVSVRAIVRVRVRDKSVART